MGRTWIASLYHEADERIPTWSPDGRSVIFEGERDGRGELYRVWLGDKQVDRLTNSVNRAISPAASPDGRYVAYAAQTIMDFQIDLLDSRTLQTRQLTSGGGACRPNWTRDSRRIAYVRLAAEPSTMEVMTIATGEIQTFFAHPKLWSYYPAWSPRAALIAFSISPEHHKGEDWDSCALRFREAGSVRLPDPGPGQ